eukprot:2521845-Prymnesium_polylepis.1
MARRAHGSSGSARPSGKAHSAWGPAPTWHTHMGDSRARGGRARWTHERTCIVDAKRTTTMWRIESTLRTSISTRSSRSSRIADRLASAMKGSSSGAQPVHTTAESSRFHESMKYPRMPIAVSLTVISAVKRHR